MRILLAVLLLVAAPPLRQATPPNLLLCIADDWSWPHAGVYGDGVVKTPVFDRVAAEGVLFTNSFCASPSCTPSRAALLTGQAIHRLEESGNLWSTLQPKFETYPDLLEKAGYVVGLQGKGWGPGDFKAAGRTRNPAGPNFKSFPEFLKTVPKDKPFCFWYGSQDPHRPYVKDAGEKAGIDPTRVAVPAFLPDLPEIRGDVADYYFEVQRFDSSVGEILKNLEESGRAPNTIVLVTSDNGMPFPRAKTNLHDSGTHMPLAVRWPEKVKGGRKIEDFVSHCDLAPTLLEAAGLKPPAAMTGRSLMEMLTGTTWAPRPRVFTGRERHANVRKGDLSFPARAIRTKDWLYIRNFEPDRWPGGDPEKHVAVGPYGDCDGSPSKDLVLARRETDLAKYYALAFEKRPAAQLYDLAKDPAQLMDVSAQNPGVLKTLDEELMAWLRETGDPRAASPRDGRWDKYPYYGK